MEALRRSPHGRYEIVDQIGQGSMGAVYRARDLETGENVALKVIEEAASLDEADLGSLRRLLGNEAGAAALVSHPGIVRIRDLVEGPSASETFLVMDYVDGSSLAEILARPDPIPFDFVVKVIDEVAEVLDHVHGHGVVHRDIKPANILIGDTDGVRVTDFGLADLRGGGLAADLQRAGSPSYMAPERVLGTGCDYRGDIWALGVVLYEMLTRRRPFQGESVAAVVTAVASEEPAPLDAHGAPILPGLQPIVDRALAKEPDDRYPFAGEIATELKAVQASQMHLSATLPAVSIPEVAAPVDEAPADEPEESLRATLAERVGSSLPALAARFRRFQPSPRGVVAIFGGLAVLVVLLLLLGEGTLRERPSARATEVSVVQQQRFEYLGLLEQARDLLEEGDPEAAAELFERAEGLSPHPERIRALRDAARRQAASEIEGAVELEVAALVGIGEVDLSEGRLSAAEDAALRALEVSPRHRAAHRLAAAVDVARRAARARAEREAYERLLAERPPPPAEPPPAEPLRVTQPIRPPVAAPVPHFSDLKVDFYSELPRGVLTVYRAESQILRRPFRFVERKRFMRTKGISGGFDEQVRVKAGPTDLRVYLSLPDRETQIRRVSGILPPGAIRALQVRVDASGELSVALH